MAFQRPKDKKFSPANVLLAEYRAIMMFKYSHKKAIQKRKKYYQTVKFNLRKSPVLFLSLLQKIKYLH